MIVQEFTLFENLINFLCYSYLYSISISNFSMRLMVLTIAMVVIMVVLSSSSHSLFLFSLIFFLKKLKMYINEKSNFLFSFSSVKIKKYLLKNLHKKEKHKPLHKNEHHLQMYVRNYLSKSKLVSKHVKTHSLYF